MIMCHFFSVLHFSLWVFFCFLNFGPNCYPFPRCRFIKPITWKVTGFQLKTKWKYAKENRTRVEWNISIVFAPELVCDKPVRLQYLSWSDSFNNGSVSQLMDFLGGEESIAVFGKRKKISRFPRSLLSYLTNSPPHSSLVSHPHHVFHGC